MVVLEFHARNGHNDWSLQENVLNFTLSSADDPLNHIATRPVLNGHPSVSLKMATAANCTMKNRYKKKSGTRTVPLFKISNNWWNKRSSMTFVCTFSLFGKGEIQKLVNGVR